MGQIWDKNGTKTGQIGNLTKILSEHHSAEFYLYVDVKNKTAVNCFCFQTLNTALAQYARYQSDLELSPSPI